MMLVATCASPTSRIRSVTRPCGLRITSKRCSYQASSASDVDGSRKRIGNLGELLVKRREHRKNTQQGFRRGRLHDKPLAFLANYGVVAGQFKPSRYTHCLVPPVLK